MPQDKPSVAPKQKPIVFRATVRACHSAKTTQVVNADGTPMGVAHDHHAPCEMTVSAVDEAAARKFIEEHNPLCRIDSCEPLDPQPES